MYCWGSQDGGQTFLLKQTRKGLYTYISAEIQDMYKDKKRLKTEDNLIYL